MYTNWVMSYIAVVISSFAILLLISTRVLLYVISVQNHSQFSSFIQFYNNF